MSPPTANAQPTTSVGVTLDVDPPVFGVDEVATLTVDLVSAEPITVTAPNLTVDLPSRPGGQIVVATPPT